MIIYYTDKFTGGREESHRLLERALKAFTGDEHRAATLIGALKKGEHGKPFIEGFSCFSISHTGGIWAVLFAQRECGLDIQLFRKCDMSAISERWFAPEDTESIRSAADERSAENTFFRIWSRREALTKALGGTVYDTDLPPALAKEAVVNGDSYIMQDIQIPEIPEIYAAVCYHSDEVGSELSFVHM